jgi:hypothetical protein
LIEQFPTDQTAGRGDRLDAIIEDAVEAMRAKCEAIARDETDFAEVHSDDFAKGFDFATQVIADAIAALRKGSGE